MEAQGTHSIQQSIESLGPWFHNFHLPGGLQTAPLHFLGDFPAQQWKYIANKLPADLSGWSVLDIGCNAGFYSFELARRGAQVLGIDSDVHYLNQARWIAENFYDDNSPTFLRMQIHELSRVKKKFDLVLFMGVFYHLRYPSLALDTVSSLTNKTLVFQTLSMNEEKVFTPENDYPIYRRDVFNEPGWPKMAFIENSFSNDWTNWWVPNHAAIEAMLRSTGFEKIERISEETYLCTCPPGGVAQNRKWDIEEWNSAVGLSFQGSHDD